jgi:PKD repeat protein
MLNVSGNISLTTDNSYLKFGAKSNATIRYDGTNLVFNITNAGQYIWKQQLTVIPNQTYDISLFLASMVANNNSGSIQLRVDGIDVGPVMNCPGPVNTWVPFSNLWTAGASASVSVSLHSMNGSSGGNDFGVDNIQMICTSCAGNVTYQWNTGESGTSIYADSTGAYTVTVSDAIGCSATSLPINVLVQTPPSVNLGGPYTSCGGSVTLDAQNAGQSFLWNNASTSQTIETDTSGVFAVTVSDGNGCSNSDSINVIISSLSGELIASSNIVDVSDQIDVTFNLNITSAADSIVWDFGDGDTLHNSLSVNHFFATEGVYDVTATIYNNACTLILQTQIIVSNTTSSLNSSMPFTNG